MIGRQRKEPQAEVLRLRSIIWLLIDSKDEWDHEYTKEFERYAKHPNLHEFVHGHDLGKCLVCKKAHP